MEKPYILIVDDEDDFRNAIIRRMKKRGLNVIDAESGETALFMMDVHPVDVIISDVKMPGMDGIALLELIKIKYPESEIILLTGNANANDGVSGIKKGAFDYLSKPIALEHLINKINQAREKITRKSQEKKESEFKKNIRQKMIATERLASLGTLSAGVAHEINNPLAIINEACGWMMNILSNDTMRDIPRKKDFEKALNSIENAVLRARDITHQLLQYSRKPDFLISEVNIVNLVNETLQLLKKETVSKSISIKIKQNSPHKSIWSDPAQIRQILLNILTNAIHASDQQGLISILISSQDKGILIEIKDTGPGIPEENMDQIFEPFYTTKPPGQGTGLGLFVIKGIVERLKGNLKMSSQVGQGTAVSVFLPCQYDLKQDEKEGIK
ncbi:integral membrane sensor signal transduction histidine kinase [Candidatus Magnetomorum sp. HK-1]|nr:integral membrane sensor signal transduction histidine kinase [Candidatus Magnetomorum sp. HK-1]